MDFLLFSLFMGLYYFKFSELTKNIPIHFDLEGKPIIMEKIFYISLPIIGDLLFFSFNIKKIKNYPVEITQENKKQSNFPLKLLAVNALLVLFYSFFNFQKEFENKNY